MARNFGRKEDNTGGNWLDLWRLISTEETNTRGNGWFYRFLRTYRRNKQSVIAHEFVTFQGGGDLIGRDLRTVRYPLGAQYLADTAEADRLRSVVIQGDDVFDRPAQIRLVAGSKEHSRGADFLGETGYGHAFRTSACDRER